MVFIFLFMVISFSVYCSLSLLVYIHHKFTLLTAKLWPIKRTARFANATSEKEAYGVSFGKHTSMSHVASYRAANFIRMGSPAYNALDSLQKGLNLQTDQQAQPPSQLKKKHHRQHLKQTHCPTQSLQPLRPLETYRPRT